MFQIFKKREYIDVLYDWLKNKKEIKIQSKQKYGRLIHCYLKENLGKTNIRKMKSNTILNFFDKLNKEHVSLSVQKGLLYIIKASLEWAYHHHLCESIDLREIKIKKKKQTIYVLSKEEQKILEEFLNQKINIRKLSLLLCLYTGLRVGEICGLKWEDINFTSKCLEVKRTIQRIKNKSNECNKTILIESTPKSETSNRIVPIPDFLILLLEKMKKENQNYILSGSNKLYDPRYLESFYANTLKKCNIKNNKFHTLRHTFATRSIESKMDIKTLSEILGHSSVQITLELYVHPSYELKKNSIENLAEFMLN